MGCRRFWGHQLQHAHAVTNMFDATIPGGGGGGGGGEDGDYFFFNYKYV